MNPTTPRGGSFSDRAPPARSTRSAGGDRPEAVAVHSINMKLSEMGILSRRFQVPGSDVSEKSELSEMSELSGMLEG